MRYKIDEIVQLIMDYRGKTPKKLGMNWTENQKDVIALSAKNIKDNKIVNTDKSHYGSELLYKHWMKDGDIEPGDILMTSEAPLGEVYLVSKPIKAILSQRLFLLRFNKKIVNPWYMYAFMNSQSFKNQLLLRATGTTVVGIKQKDLKKIEVELPNIELQNKIGSIFQFLDKKIHINGRINDNLLELMDNLFYNFFPQVNVGNDLIGYFIQNYDRFRKPLSKKQRSAILGKYRYIGAASVMDYINKYNFDGIYLLLGEDGTVVDNKGYPILQYVFGKFWPNNHTHVLKGKNISTEWLYLFFRQRKVLNIVTGAVQKKISQKNLNSLEFSYPNKEDYLKFNEIIQPLFRDIRIRIKESKRLRQLKQELLKQYL